MLRVCCIIVAFITAEGALLATTPRIVSQQPSTAVQSKKPNPPAPPKDGMMPIVAPLFVEDATTYSEITMVNSLGLELGVDVVVSSASGKELARKRVTMEPRSQQKLKLADLLQDAPVDLDATYGSVSLMADRPSPLAAQLSIVRHNGSSPTDIEEEFAMLTGSGLANYRAVTDELSAMPLVAVRSLSAKEQTVSIECLFENGRTGRRNFAIQSNQTLLIQACDERGSRLIDRLEQGLDLASNGKKAMGISVSSSAPLKNWRFLDLASMAKKQTARFRPYSFGRSTYLNHRRPSIPACLLL